MVTAEQVKALREQTGISIMECKKALEEAGGDPSKALVILKKRGAMIAAKKAGRTLGAGVVQAYVHASKDVGAMVALSCETDFVAKNPEFVSLAYDIAMHTAALSPAVISREGAKSQAPEEGSVLLEQSFVKDPTVTVKDLLDKATQKFGEKIEITDMIRFSFRKGV